MSSSFYVFKSLLWTCWTIDIDTVVADKNHKAGNKNDILGQKDIDDTGRDYETGDNDHFERHDEACGNDEACENDESCMILSVFGRVGQYGLFATNTITIQLPPNCFFYNIITIQYRKWSLRNNTITIQL